MPTWSLVYVSVVASVALISLARILFGMWRRHRERMEAFRRRDLIEAVHADSPPGPDPVEEAKRRGLGSMDARFTVHRRLLLPGIVGLCAVLASLPFVGALPAAVLSTVIAVVTVILGIAARPMIENAIAGLMMSYSNLLRIGDIVVYDEHYGTVEDISVTHTTIKIWDWRRYVIPNSQMLQAKVVNYSLHDKYRWIYVEFFVSYDADPALVRDIAMRSPLSSEYFAPYEDPQFWIMGMDKESLRCWVAAWADDPSKAWYLGADMRESLWREFRAHGIRAHVHRHELHGADHAEKPQAGAPANEPPPELRAVAASDAAGMASS